MAMNISIGYYYNYEDKKSMVGFTMNGECMGLTPELARDLAVDLMLWADRLEPKNNEED